LIGVWSWASIYRVDLQQYSRADAGSYMRVNHLYADHLSALMNEDDVVWVHDYHLMALARELRSRGHRKRIGFFLHTPRAPPDILQTLPHHREILGGLTCCDLVGFQTKNDRDNFADYLVRQGARQTRGGYEIDSRRVRLGAFPVSIETKAYMRLARNAGRSAMVALVRESLGGSRLVLSVDRLDCSKGIPQRIKAFERFLEMYPDWHGKATLLQLTPKSWSDIKHYAEIESEVAACPTPVVRRIARFLRRKTIDETINLRDGEANDANIELDVRFHVLLQLKRQQFLIPARVEGELIVRQHVGALLCGRHVLDAQARNSLHPELARRLNAAVASQDPVLAVDQYRIGETEAANAFGNLADLLA
jgi:hypothetical protein